MKIKEIIHRVNKSDQFKCIVYIGDIAESISIDARNYDDQDRLISYYIGSWYCTDSYVGYKVYFFDNEPVAVSAQTSRKATEEVEWLSKECYKKVKDYILTFVQENEDDIQLCNMDEDIGKSYKIHFTGQLFDYHKNIPLFKGESVKIIEEEKREDNWGIEKKVKILMKDNTEKWVELQELDFPYNVLQE